MEDDETKDPVKEEQGKKEEQRKKRDRARIVGMIAGNSIVAAIVFILGLQHNFTVWAWLIFLYLLLAIASFMPVLWAILFRAEPHDDVPSFAKSPFLKGKTEVIERLEQHYKRISGTLVFWKSAARRNGWFHYYCIGWTIFSTAMIPFLTQAINPADSASKWLVTTISAHIAILVGFHRGLKVPERYQAFRHGESEFYDLYRRLLDQPETFGLKWRNGSESTSTKWPSSADSCGRPKQTVSHHWRTSEESPTP
jgi:hypothetical protein